MKTIIKNYLTILLTMIVFFSIPNIILADVVKITNPISANSVGELVNDFADIFTYVVILFGVLAIVYVGFRFVLAQGKPEELKTLKSWLGWIVVGIAIVIGARVIIRVMINTLSATKTVNQSVIDSANRALDGK